MWILLLILFPVLELFVLFRVGAQVGLANTFFALLAAAVFGIGLVRSQGFFLLRNMQASIGRGEVPTKAIFHSLLMFLAGAFFIFPGYISDFIGLILLLPGSRHLVANMMQKKLSEKIAQGKMRFQTFTGGVGGPFSGGFTAGFGGGSAGPTTGPRTSDPFRDVTPRELDSEDFKTADIIDITPKKPNSDS